MRILQNFIKNTCVLLCIAGFIRSAEASSLVDRNSFHYTNLLALSRSPDGFAIHCPFLKMDITKISDSEYRFGNFITMFLSNHPERSLLDLTCILLNDGGAVGFERDPFTKIPVSVNAFIDKLLSDAALSSWVTELAANPIIPDNEEEEEEI
ncbi:MAG: hypothetical protein LBJ77_04140 [Holosporales bacterium]|nr:hypothetical protein [Holosporales bacterium]